MFKNNLRYNREFTYCLLLGICNPLLCQLGSFSCRFLEKTVKSLSLFWRFSTCAVDSLNTESTEKTEYSYIIERREAEIKEKEMYERKRERTEVATPLWRERRAMRYGSAASYSDECHSLLPLTYHFSLITSHFLCFSAFNFQPHSGFFTEAAPAFFAAKPLWSAAGTSC